jgi:putative DNA primase/helicase
MSGEAVADFLSAMEAAGVRPVEPIAQALGGGSLVRFRCDGDKPGRRNGWALLHLDGRPAGAFGWYSAGIRERWRADRQEAVSPAERLRLQREWRETSRRRDAERQAAQEAASVEAARLWTLGTAPDPRHPYLVRKGLPGEGLRQHGNRLLVPMRDVTGRLWNLQRIAPDGFKTFLPGGRVSGLLSIIGGGGSRACLGEGWATMAAVRLSTGLPCIVAFSGENLEAVARSVRRQWPGLDLIICADDDRHLVNHPKIQKNLGLEYATAAAAAVGARVALPRMEAA